MSIDAEVSKNILEPTERIEVDTLTIPCDGGGGALGHPRIFLTLKNGQAECGYCGKLYVLKAGIINRTDLK